MNVLLVGCNPSFHNTDSNVPFEGTRSGVILKDWIEQLNIERYLTVNAISMISNTAASIRAEDKKRGADVLSRLISNNEYTHIIALGKVAEEVLRKTAVDKSRVFALWHPSGLNRKLNNKKALNKKLAACKRWLGT